MTIKLNGFSIIRMKVLVLNLDPKCDRAKSTLRFFCQIQMRPVFKVKALTLASC